MFKTAFSIGGQSKNIDKTLDTLAADYKLTDLKNGNGSIMNSLRSGKTDFNPMWGTVPVTPKDDSGKPMGDTVSGVIGGARVSENVIRPSGGGLTVAYEKERTAYDLSAPRAVPLSPKHVDHTDIRTVKPA